MRCTVPTPTPNAEAILHSPGLFFFLRAAWIAHPVFSVILAGRGHFRNLQTISARAGERPSRARPTKARDAAYPIEGKMKRRDRCAPPTPIGGGRKIGVAKSRKRPKREVEHHDS
jgi:hypothetical protein